MNEPAFSDHVVRLADDGRDTYIVGTAHVSRRSVEEVEHVISTLRPDTVCVELDPLRHEVLMDEHRWRKLDVFQIIREKKVLFLLASLALSAYQKKIGEKLGVRPGAELRAAVQAAEAVGAELVLADRDIQATLKRTWANLSFWNKLKLTSVMIAAPFAVSDISEEKIEELKDRDTIGEMLDELAKAMPEVKQPLIDERDLWLMSAVDAAPGKRVVAVVGAGHVRGMLAHRGEPVDREALTRIPPPSKVTAALKWVIPLVVLSAFYFGWREHSAEGLKQMLFAWIIPNSVAAALFSIVAGAKPLTILVALLASPITSLNPTIGAGMAAGLVEAWLRKPTVEDCEKLGDDVLSVRGVYRNRVSRVLLVTVLSTLGSAVGAWVGASWVISLL